MHKQHQTLGIFVLPRFRTIRGTVGPTSVPRFSWKSVNTMNTIMIVGYRKVLHVRVYNVCTEKSDPNERNWSLSRTCANTGAFGYFDSEGSTTNRRERLLWRRHTFAAWYEAAGERSISERSCRVKVIFVARALCTGSLLKGSTVL